MTDRIEEVFNCWADKMTAGDVPAMGLKAFRAAVAEILEKEHKSLPALGTCDHIKRPHPYKDWICENWKPLAEQRESGKPGGRE